MLNIILNMVANRSSTLKVINYSLQLIETPYECKKSSLSGDSIMQLFLIASVNFPIGRTC